MCLLMHPAFCLLLHLEVCTYGLTFINTHPSITLNIQINFKITQHWDARCWSSPPSRLGRTGGQLNKIHKTRNWLVNEACEEGASVEINYQSGTVPACDQQALTCGAFSLWVCVCVCVLVCLCVSTVKLRDSASRNLITWILEKRENTTPSVCQHISWVCVMKRAYIFMKVWKCTNSLKVLLHQYLHRRTLHVLMRSSPCLCKT